MNGFIESYGTISGAAQSHGRAQALAGASQNQRRVFAGTRLMERRSISFASRLPEDG
jgi:hypothetical protein